MMRTNIWLYLLVLLTPAVKAQWELNLEKSINWYQIAPTGNLILGTAEGIVSVNEHSGEVIYTVPNRAIVLEEEFQVVPNTPFGMIRRKAGRVEAVSLFKLTDGKVLFDSEKEGISIVKQYFLGSTGDFIFQGVRGMESVFFMVDIVTGSIRWQQVNVFGTGLFAEVMDGFPIENEDGNFILPTIGGMGGGGIYCFSPLDGQLIWKANLPKLKGPQTTTITDSKLITSFFEKDKFIYVRGQAVMAYDIISGEAIWPEPAKQRGLPDRLIYDPFGLIVASAVDPNNSIFKPTMAMYDYDTGKELWPEQVKLKGTITAYSYCDQGLLICMDAAGGKSLIDIIDLDKGVYVFENAFRVNGFVEEMQIAGSAVYVRTNLEEDFISFENGQSILTKNISTKPDKALLNTRNGDLSFTFNPSDNNLYKSDLSDQTQVLITAAKIEFEKNEIPSRIEILNDKIILASDQTVAAYDFSGNEIYKTHIPAPGISGWKKALYATSAALNTLDALRYAELEVEAKKVGAASNTPQTRQLCDAIGQIANSGANIRLTAAAQDMDKIRTRFKATASGNNLHFVLGKLESKDFGLFGISKESGTKISQINFGEDKEPRYLLDDVSRVIYYLDRNDVLKAIPF